MFIDVICTIEQGRKGGYVPPVSPQHQLQAQEPIILRDPTEEDFARLEQLHAPTDAEDNIQNVVESAQTAVWTTGNSPSSVSKSTESPGSKSTDSQVYHECRGESDQDSDHEVEKGEDEASSCTDSSDEKDGVTSMLSQRMTVSGAVPSPLDELRQENQPQRKIAPGILPVGDLIGVAQHGMRVSQQQQTLSLALRGGDGTISAAEQQKMDAAHDALIERSLAEAEGVQTI